MITIDPIHIYDLPISRQQVGFPEQADRGNAVLLVTQDMPPVAWLIYQQCAGVPGLPCCDLALAVMLSCTFLS